MMKPLFSFLQNFIDLQAASSFGQVATVLQTVQEFEQDFKRLIRINLINSSFVANFS